jgi:hypothetical protein
VNRREFLKHAGRAAAAVALLGVPGCTASPSTMTTQPPAPTPSPRPNRPPTDADWAGLASRISGSVVRPGNASYAAAARLFNPRKASLGRSDIVLQPWSSAAVNIVLAGAAQRQANPRATTVAGVALDALGGAINRVPADATAFVHRNATWPTGASANVVQSNVDGVNALYAAMRPYASGSAYQNYIDPQLVDWQTAYYGSNLARLKTVKARYDPGDLFHFAQGIPVQ